MSKCIIKLVYLEKLKQLIIWNGWSVSFAWCVPLLLAVWPLLLFFFWYGSYKFQGFKPPARLSSLNQGR